MPATIFDKFGGGWVGVDKVLWGAGGRRGCVGWVREGEDLGGEGEREGVNSLAVGESGREMGLGVGVGAAIPIVVVGGGAGKSWSRP